MRRRHLLCLAVGILLLAVFWRWGFSLLGPERHQATSHRIPAAQTFQLLSKDSEVGSATRVPQFTDPSAPHRLRNTPERVGTLLRKNTALLLENAFYDTTLPLPISIPENLHAKGDPRAYLVQSKGVANDSFRRTLSQAGALTISYIPNNAYLVRASAEVARRLSAAPDIQAVLPYEPYYKLKSSLLDQVLAAETGETPLRMLLFADLRDETLERIAASNVPVSAQYPSPFGPVIELRCPCSQVATLASLPGVQEIEIAHRPIPSADLSRATLRITPTPTSPSPYLGLTGSNIVVQVVDTGVDASHPALAGRVFTSDATSAFDTNGHGTHVAGLIAGNGAQSTTVTNVSGSVLPPVADQFRGMAPGARIFSVGFSAATGAPPITAEILKAGANTNALISNNSWNYDANYDYDLAAAIFDAATRDALPSASGSQPLICVVSAGNSGPYSGSSTRGFAGLVQSPATAKNVISVGALEQPRSITNQTWTCTNSICETNTPWLPLTDSSNQVAGFSSRGNVGIGTEGEFGRFKPDVMAPGVFVLSTRSAQWNESAYYAATNEWLVPDPDANYCGSLSNLDSCAGPFYRFESGTSIAAAEVSGALALMEDFFQGRLGVSNSPALLKALLVNGARPMASYDFAAQNRTNVEGWGLVQLPNSIPASLTNRQSSANSLLFVDQSPANALATGDRRTLSISVRSEARSYPLRVTLSWTDPPGNPVAGLKLVNDLDLIVTNLDTGEVFLGNNFPPGSRFTPSTDFSRDASDCINNLENVFLPALLGGNYSVTVVAKSVQVNSVTALAGVRQDYALVIASGDGEVPDALSMSASAPVLANASEVTVLTNQFSASDSDVGCILPMQQVGADSPLSSSNAVSLGGTAAAVINVGSANQWHFYIFNNETLFTNAAFATFSSDTAAGLGGSTAEADIDLYVSTDPSLTNLDLNAIATADKSLGRGGSEMVVYSNAIPGVYYIGVKCESQRAAQFGFVAVVSELPFAQTDTAGNQTLRGVPSSAAIPANGKTVQLFFPAADLLVRRVLLTNVLNHPVPIDLQAILSSGAASAVLMNYSNHPSGTLLFDDSGEGDIPGNTPSDGPGDLRAFAGSSGGSLWLLNVTSTNRPGTNVSASIFLEREPDLMQGGSATILPGACRQDYIIAGKAMTNLQALVSLISGPGPVTVQVFPANLVPALAPLLYLRSPGDSVPFNFDNTSVPPLASGSYVVRMCNSGPDPAALSILASQSSDPTGEKLTHFASNIPLNISDDAISSSSIPVTNQEQVASIAAAVRIVHPRVADLILTLVSPSGTRVLLQDGRGGASSDGMGTTIVQTNSTTLSWSGGPEPVTNSLDTGQVAGSIHVVYQFYDLPDEMLVLYQNSVLFDSGLVSGGLTNDYNFGPGNSTVVTIIMNPNGNPESSTVWSYKISSMHDVPVYLTFTEDTNLTSVPIKFAPTPFTNLNYTVQGTSPSMGIFYLPEQSLERFRGERANGLWTLEIADTRAGGTSPPPQLLGWRLDMSFRPAVPVPVAMAPSMPWTNFLAPNQVQWFAVSPPLWSSFATNSLLFSGPPVNLLFNAHVPPTGTNVDDVVLLANSHGGSVVLSTNGGASFIPGSRYFLAIQNTNSVTASYSVQVDFDVNSIVTLQNQEPYQGFSRSQDYYRYVVSTNAARVQFELDSPGTDLALVLRKGLPLPGPTSFDYMSSNPGLANELIVVRDSSVPVPVAPGDWYLAVLNPWTVAASYTLLVTEFSSSGTDLTITNAVLTNNSLCLTWNSLPGAFYFIEGSNTFGPSDWTAVSATLRATDVSTTYCVPLPSPYQFFRVREGLYVPPLPLQIVSASIDSQGTRLRWSADADSHFQVQWTASLSAPSWTPFTNIVSSTTSAFEFRDDGSQTGRGSIRFYRLLQLP